MNTSQRTEAIAMAAEPFRALLGPTTAEDLLAWLHAELGSSEALDLWVTCGKAKTKAIAPETILHVVSSNTPHAALQSLIGGLLLGSRNLVKLPRGGIIEVDEFVSGLPEALRAKVEIAE
ncbi:MAG: acyl-CoA reductase, partial [Sphaerospermopsis kisseleviana]